jgi:PAS domain S-box-containing protein
MAGARDGMSSRMTREQLLKELEALRLRVAQLEALEAERRQAEEALRQSEQKYRLLAENVTDLIYVMDMKMKVTYLNPSITRLLGFSVEEGMARSLADSLTPASLGLAAKALQSVLSAGQVRLGDFQDRQTVELEMYRKDGSTIWAESLVTVMRDSDGRPVGILGVTRDISDRKRAEEELGRSEERYRLLFENYGDPITVYSIDGRLLLINSVGARNFGGRPKDFVGKSYVELFLEQGSTYLERHQAIALSGVAADFEDMVELPSGKHWFWSIIQPIRDQSGNVYAVQTISHDITKRKRAEEALRESEAKLRSAFESSPDIMYMVDRDFRIIFINRVLPGYDPKEVLGSKVTNWMPPQSQDIMKKSLEEVFLTGETQTLDMIGYGEHGSMAWYWTRLAPVKEGDRILAVLMTSRDISERKRVAEELRDAYERETKLRSELEEEVRKRVEFTRALVHELKTPLTSVIASGELLAMDLPDGPLLALVNNINRSAYNLNARIDELLDLARGELGMLRLNLTSVDPMALLQQLAEEMGPVALSRHQSLALDLPSSLPQIRADGVRLRQVVLNLLSNASKFTGEGGKITLKAREESDRLIVEVEDTGPGISEEEQQRLFFPYHRLMGDRERLSGLGLGLALSKTLVELHGGQIWVRSHLGKGSIFGFSVPLATASQRGEEAKSEAE